MYSFSQCFLISTFFIMVSSNGDIGPGIWNVKSIAKCPDDAAFRFKFAIEKSKINRTCAGFNADFVFDKDIDDTFACRIEICKYMDGGCKPFQVVVDDSFARFVNKYAEINFKNALELAGMTDTNFPLKQGEYQIKKYVFNPCELPPKGYYGMYDAVAYLVKDSIDVACLIATVEFIVDDECICRPEEECE